MKNYKPCKIVTDKRDNKMYLYLIKDNEPMPNSLDNLIALPDTFKITFDVEPMVKQFKAIGYKVRGNRYLSQKTGNVQTDLFIAL